MHCRLALVALLGAAALVPAAPAAAKQVVGVSVCGAAGCVDRTSLLGPQRTDGGLLDIGNVRISDPEPAPFVRVKLRIGDGSGEEFGATTLVVVPARRAALTEDGSWWLLPARATKQLRPLLRGVALRPWAELRIPATPAPAAAAGGDGGLGTGATLGLAAALVAALAGAAALVAQRRRRNHGLGETPATG